MNGEFWGRRIWPEGFDPSWWDILNSEALSTAVGALVAVLVFVANARLARTRRAVDRAAEQAREDADDAAQLRRAEARFEGAEAEADVDALTYAAPSAPGAPDYFERAQSQEQTRKAAPSPRSRGRAAASALRDALDARAQAAPTPRLRRKYRNAPRRDYRVLVELMREDGVMNQDAAASAMSALAQWRPYASRETETSPPETVLTALESARKAVGGGARKG